MGKFDRVDRATLVDPNDCAISVFIEYDIVGEGSQISTNQKRGNSAFSLLIG